MHPHDDWLGTDNAETKMSSDRNASMLNQHYFL